MRISVVSFLFFINFYGLTFFSLELHCLFLWILQKRGSVETCFCKPLLVLLLLLTFDPPFYSLGLKPAYLLPLYALQPLHCFIVWNASSHYFSFLSLHTSLTLRVSFMCTIYSGHFALHRSDIIKSFLGYSITLEQSQLYTFYRL
jgi:hypothetical protein